MKYYLENMSDEQIEEIFKFAHGVVEDKINEVIGN
jgi:hypothetical protein